MGLGTNLGNTFEACDANRGKTGADPSHYETLWGQPVTAREMIRDIHEAGFGTIRVPVAWMTNASHLSSGDYTLDQAYIDRVAEVVRWALDEGMYVISIAAHRRNARNLFRVLLFFIMKPLH